MKRLLRYGLTIPVLVVILLGCQEPRTDPADVPLLVLAASSHRSVLPSIVSVFTAATGTPVQVSYGSTAALAAQIENGAPADLLLAADDEIVGRLAADGHVRPGGTSVFARGRLVVVWREGKTPPVRRLDDLTDDEYSVIAIANPEVAPYGRAAREVIDAAGIRPRVEAKLVSTESVSQAMQLVLSGNADAAFTAAGLLGELAALPSHLSIDGSLYSPINHTVAILADSRHPRADEFRRILLGPEARELLERHGFSVKAG